MQPIPLDVRAPKKAPSLDSYRPSLKKPRRDYVAIVRFGTGAGWRFDIRSGVGRNAREACGQIERAEAGIQVLHVVEVAGIADLKKELKLLRSDV